MSREVACLNHPCYISSPLKLAHHKYLSRLPPISVTQRLWWCAPKELCLKVISPASALQKLKVASPCRRKSQPEWICPAVLRREHKFEKHINILSNPESTLAGITKQSVSEICLQDLALRPYYSCARRIVVKSRCCTIRVKLQWMSNSGTPTVATVTWFRDDETARCTCLKEARNNRRIWPSWGKHLM